MLMMRRYLEGSLRLGVIPRDTPTVAKALQFSKKISSELMAGSRLQIRMVKQPIQAQETTTVITHRATVRWSMRRWKNSTWSRPRRMRRISAPAMAQVVVLMPPAVPPGLPPTTIRPHMMRLAAGR